MFFMDQERLILLVALTHLSLKGQKVQRFNGFNGFNDPRKGTSLKPGEDVQIEDLLETRESIRLVRALRFQLIKDCKPA